MPKTVRSKRLFSTRNTTRSKKAAHNNVRSYLSVPYRSKTKLVEITPKLYSQMVGQDLFFRSPPLLRSMMEDYKRDGSLRLNGQNVKFILIIAHGSINEDSLTSPPANVAVFHPSEDKYRGTLLLNTEVAPLVKTVFGKRGANLSRFLNVMTGGYSPTLRYYDQMAYTTPGDKMYDYTLSREKDDLENLMGVYNVTNSLHVIEPANFNCVGKKTKSLCDPNRGREGTYERIPALESDLDRTISSGAMMGKIKELYSDSICFITFLCCSEVSAFPTGEIKAPPAFSHHPYPRFNSSAYKSGTYSRRPSGSKGRPGSKKLHSKNLPDDDDDMAEAIIDDVQVERMKNPRTYKQAMKHKYDIEIVEKGDTVTVFRPDPTHIPGNPLFPGNGYVPGAPPPYVVWFTISNE